MAKATLASAPPKPEIERLRPFVPRLAVEWLRETPGERVRVYPGTLVFAEYLSLVAECDLVVSADTARAGIVGYPLPDTVMVRVADTIGTALVDVPVAWTALDKGTVEVIHERTDSLGEARAVWTLGPRAGRQRLRVQAGNARTIPPVTLTASWVFARVGPGRTRALSTQPRCRRSRRAAVIPFTFCCR